MALNRGGKLHVLILALFAIYMISANWVFDSIRNSSSEHKFVTLDFSKATTDIDSHVEILEEKALSGKKYLHIEGWAFVKNDKKNNGTVFLVLGNGKGKKGLTTKTYFRADLDEHFNRVKADSTRDNGYYVMAPKEFVRDGKYRLGIYIDNGATKHFSNSNRYFTKTREGIISEFVATPQKISLPDRNDKVTYGVEAATEKTIDGKQYLNIVGWAYSGKLSEEANKYVVLKSQESQYVFDAGVVNRPDVAKYFNRLNDGLENSGFSTFIPAGTIKDGVYEVGIYIDDGGNRNYSMNGTLYYTNGILYKK